MKRYKTIYRPPGYGTLPKGAWTLVEAGTGGFFIGRTDLPMGRTLFGVFTFERDLTPEELETFEIEEVK